MCYENYLSSLKRNLVDISKAVKGGVNLSRLERFDYLFKKELSIIEGLRPQRGILNRVYNNISDSDFRLACFYARGFSDIMDTIENGYSVKGITKQYKSYIKEAESKYICSETAIAHVSDLNGEIKVVVVTDSTEKVLTINNMEDYVETSLYILSLLGSLDETDLGYRDWFNSYLSKEYGRVVNDCNAEVFVEKSSVAKDLKTYMVSNTKAKTVKSENGKVVYLVK